jgi:hypothetical protein
MSEQENEPKQLTGSNIDRILQLIDEVTSHGIYDPSKQFVITVPPRVWDEIWHQVNSGTMWGSDVWRLEHADSHWATIIGPMRGQLVRVTADPSLTNAVYVTSGELRDSAYSYHCGGGT